MAVKVTDQATTSASSKDAASSDMAILHPDGELVIAGRTIVMREYGHVEGLRLLTWAQPFVDDLQRVFEAARTAPRLAAIEQLLARNVDLYVRMAAQAADVEPGWVEQLNEADGELFMAAWWSVTGPFFSRRVLRQAVEQRLENRLAGGGSTPTSSTPATDVPLPTSGA